VRNDDRSPIRGAGVFARHGSASQQHECRLRHRPPPATEPNRHGHSSSRWTVAARFARSWSPRHSAGNCHRRARPNSTSSESRCFSCSGGPTSWRSGESGFPEASRRTAHPALVPVGRRPGRRGQVMVWRAPRCRASQASAARYRAVGRSNRSRFITLVQAATKSVTNLSPASALA